MIREIVTIGHPVLRQRASTVARELISDPVIQSLIDDLIETMRDANGAGLAANQIGEPVQIAVIEVNNNPRYPYKPNIPLTVLINPVLEMVGEETFTVNEGCLSVPNLRGDVERHAAVRVNYLDRHGAAQSVVLRGISAGTFQHECDHLDGTLFIDLVTDTTTLTTWEQFERFHREAFVERITAFQHRITEQHSTEQQPAEQQPAEQQPIDG
jgi:peptide deformylase